MQIFWPWRSAQKNWDVYNIGDRPERRWRWLGHVLCMPPPPLSLSLSLNSLPRVVLPQEKRNRGRSKEIRRQTRKEPWVGGGGVKFRKDRTYSTLQQCSVYMHMGVYIAP